MIRFISRLMGGQSPAPPPKEEARPIFSQPAESEPAVKPAVSPEVNSTAQSKFQAREAYEGAIRALSDSHYMIYVSDNREMGRETFGIGIRNLKFAAALDDDFLEPNLLLAFFYCEARPKENLDLFLKYASAAYELAPNHPHASALWAVARLTAGSVAWDAGDLETATDEFIASINIKPSNLALRSLRATATKTNRNDDYVWICEKQGIDPEIELEEDHNVTEEFGIRGFWKDIENLEPYKMYTGDGRRIPGT